jgi:hypothetical protein
MLASRLLKFRSEKGEIEIPIRLFAPEETEGGAWSCRYEIDWPHGQWAHAAHGFDSIQAILLALQMIGSEIYVSEYHKSGKLMLEGPGRGYGFPVASSLRDLLIGDDAEYR